MASLEDFANEWTDWQNTKQDQDTLAEAIEPPWRDAKSSSDEGKDDDRAT